MGKNLRTNYKKVVFSLAVAGLAFGSTVPFNALQAETITSAEIVTEAKTDVKEAEDSKQSMAVGATTITYDGVSEKDYSVGIKGRMRKRTVINMTLEREEGFGDSDYVSLDMQFNVNMDGKNVCLYFSQPVEMTKVSDTKVTVVAPITGLTQKKDDKTKRSDVATISLDSITAAKLAGKDVEVNVNEIQYIVKKKAAETAKEDRNSKKDVKASDNEKKAVNWKF